MKASLPDLSSSFGASFGAVLGSIAAVFFSTEWYSLAIGAMLGAAIGSLVGLSHGEAVEERGGNARLENFLAGHDKLVIYIGLAFSICGIIGLMLSGWNMTLFLSTMFFALGTLYMANRSK